MQQFSKAMGNGSFPNMIARVQDERSSNFKVGKGISLENIPRNNIRWIFFHKGSFIFVGRDKVGAKCIVHSSTTTKVGNTRTDADTCVVFQVVTWFQQLFYSMMSVQHFNLARWFTCTTKNSNRFAFGRKNKARKTCNVSGSWKFHALGRQQIFKRRSWSAMLRGRYWCKSAYAAKCCFHAFSCCIHTWCHAHHRLVGDTKNTLCTMEYNFCVSGTCVPFYISWFPPSAMTNGTESLKRFKHLLTLAHNKVWHLWRNVLLYSSCH